MTRSCAQVADELAVTADRLLASLALQRQSFEQQITDARRLINESAELVCRFVDNERRRLLTDTDNIRRNTVAELDKVRLSS